MILELPTPPPTAKAKSYPATFFIQLRADGYVRVRFPSGKWSGWGPLHKDVFSWPITRGIENNLPVIAQAIKELKEQENPDD